MLVRFGLLRRVQLMLPLGLCLFLLAKQSRHRAVPSSLQLGMPTLVLPVPFVSVQVLTVPIWVAASWQWLVNLILMVATLSLRVVCTVEPC